MPHQVFVSHSSKDKTVADAVCAALEAAGIGTWIAPRDIRAGSDWGEAIVGAINGSQAMVLVFSAAADESKQVLREVERAVAKGVVIVPLRVDDRAPTGSYEYFLSATHWLDARMAPLERHLPLLVETVRDALADPGAATHHAGALAQARGAAERGDPQSLYTLGLRQLKGDGVPADPAAALQSLTRAAEQGFALAQHELAAQHEARGDVALAFRWYSRAARLGHAPAAERLAGWRGDGAVAEVESETVVAAASSPEASSATLGGRSLLIGALVVGVAVAGWLGRDALRGPARQQTATAVLVGELERGDGAVVPELATRSARGDAVAAFALARAYDEGRGVVRDLDAAREQYRMAAEQGSMAAALVLGRAAELGLGGAAVDARQATEWYARATAAGSAEGAFRAARLGPTAEAITGLTHAADLGNAEAAFELAARYAEGDGVPRDAASASRWHARGIQLAGIH